MGWRATTGASINCSKKKTSLLEFVETLEKEARHQADLLDLLRRGTIVCPTYKEVTIPSIPPEYHAFKKAQQSMLPAAKGSKNKNEKPAVEW